MDIVKIGQFLQELRKEKELTQEQLAEQFGVARRTVSRWETGSNMPDMDILIELSDFYEVDLREILSGDRKSEHMNEELIETVMQVAEYGSEGKKKMARVTLIYFVLGIVSLLINISLQYFTELPKTFWTGFLEGATLGLPLATMILGILYVTGVMNRVAELKMRLLGKAKRNKQ